MEKTIVHISGSKRNMKRFLRTISGLVNRKLITIETPKVKVEPVKKEGKPKTEPKKQTPKVKVEPVKK